MSGIYRAVQLLRLSSSNGHATYEDALAAGARLSDVYALAALHIGKLVSDGGEDSAAISYAPTVPAWRATG